MTEERRVVKAEPRQAAPAARESKPTVPEPARNTAELPSYASERVSGISMLELSDREIAVLTAPVDEEVEVEVRPDGVVYMPEICIRMRLDRAFGPGRWALKCESSPMWDSTSGEAMYDGSLWVRGYYVARAIGGCRWLPGNVQMTKADALEGARSDCLRRCCKDLGIGRELWLPSWVERWREEHAVVVKNPRTERLEWRKRRAIGTAAVNGEVRTIVEADAQADVAPVGPENTHADDLGPLPRCPKCGGELEDMRLLHRKDKADYAAGVRRVKPRPAAKCRRCRNPIWSESELALEGGPESGEDNIA